MKRKVVTLASILCVASFGIYGYLNLPSTGSIVGNPQKIFELKTYWDQGNVVALVRHSERCERSDNPCLDGATGITEPGKDEAIAVGDKFDLLPDQKTVIYHSPVKRTAQTADFMFGEQAAEQVWLREGCKEELYDNIFKHKKEPRQ